MVFGNFIAVPDFKNSKYLFIPKVRKAALEEISSAPGTSCRHHIEDGTGRNVLHPVEVSWDAVLK